MVSRDRGDTPPIRLELGTGSPQNSVAAKERRPLPHGKVAGHQRYVGADENPRAVRPKVQDWWNARRPFVQAVVLHQRQRNPPSRVVRLCGLHRRKLLWKSRSRAFQVTHERCVRQEPRREPAGGGSGTRSRARRRGATDERSCALRLPRAVLCRRLDLYVPPCCPTPDESHRLSSVLAPYEPHRLSACAPPRCEQTVGCQRPPTAFSSAT